jgi:hypothetical protein
MLAMIFMIGVAVFLGIWAYNKLGTKTITQPSSNVNTNAQGAIVFSGPDVDPRTGAYVGPGAQAGTVEFSAQNN